MKILDEEVRTIVLFVFALAVLIGFGLATGCRGADGKPSVVVEACVWTEPYGKICASFDGSVWKFTADVELPPDLLSSTSLDDLLKKIETPKSP